MKCPTCGIGNLVERVRDVPYTYKGKKAVIKAVKGRFCDNRKCREVVLDREESARTSREMLEFNKTVNSELTPIDLLTQVREQFKLTQQQAAKVCKPRECNAGILPIAVREMMTDTTPRRHDRGDLLPAQD